MLGPLVSDGHSKNAGNPDGSPDGSVFATPIKCIGLKIRNDPALHKTARSKRQQSRPESKKVDRAQDDCTQRSRGYRFSYQSEECSWRPVDTPKQARPLRRLTNPKRHLLFSTCDNGKIDTQQQASFTSTVMASLKTEQKPLSYMTKPVRVAITMPVRIWHSCMAVALA